MELKLKNKVFNTTKEKVRDKEDRFNRVSNTIYICYDYFIY